MSRPTSICRQTVRGTGGPSPATVPEGEAPPVSRTDPDREDPVAEPSITGIRTSTGEEEISMTRPRFPFLLTLLLSWAVCLTGCDILDLVDSETYTDVTVDLINDDNSLAVHILAEGEEFSSSNQLQPGKGRTVIVGAIEGQAVEFRAGRNGSVLASRQCVPKGKLSGLDAAVVWTGQALVCANWENPTDN